MLRILWLILFFSFFTGVAKAQNAILKGTLTDKIDNSPVAGATLTLSLKKDSSQTQNTVTDKNGSFEFTGLVNDTFLLVISSIGYGGETQTILSDENLKNIAIISFL